MSLRIGIGYDVHALATDRELWLGCVHFTDYSHGLLGHSDADVVSHAICDALLGAAALGDIGDHFPDSDPAYENFPGKDFLKLVAGKVRDRGFEIENVDCVVMCDIIKLGERKREMAAAIAANLEIDVGAVGVKATTHEGHGAVGRGEIIACQAIALLNTK